MIFNLFGVSDWYQHFLPPFLEYTLASAKADGNVIENDREARILILWYFGKFHYRNALKISSRKNSQVKKLVQTELSETL